MDPRRQAWLPTPDEALLLDAALCPDDRAAAAWQRVRERVLAGTDAPRTRALTRLLPLAARRHGDGTEARAQQQRARIAGVLLLKRAARVIAALEAAGVATLVLKGAALALRYYKDLGLRSMDDVDLLVRPDDVPRALAVLHAAGFTPTEALPEAVWPPRAGAPGAPNVATMAVTHACGFAADQQIDLHWSALATNCGPHADDRFWGAAVPLVVGAGADAVTTRALAPEHELVHAIVHGLRWNAEPSIRWIADAVTVLRAAPIDWARFEDEVTARGVAADVARALAFLGRYDVPVPEALVKRLAGRRAPLIDRWREAHNHWPWDRPKPPGVIAFDALRFVEGLPLRAALPVLGRYARFRVAPDGLASVPRALYEKIIRPRLTPRPHMQAHPPADV